MSARAFSRDDDEQIDADRDPDLGLDRIQGIAEEMFDRQILLEPLEEQLDLPSLLVDGGDGDRRQIEAVGQKDEVQDRLGIAERNAALLHGGLVVDLSRLWAIRQDRAGQVKIKQPPVRQISYGIVGATVNPWGLLKGHQAYMQISPLTGGGTHLNWSTQFDPRPGMGLLLPPIRLLTAFLIRTMIKKTEAALGTVN